MTPGKVPIAACSADLLDVVLDGTWHVVVDDRLDVALVDAHGEGDRAAEHPRLVFDELLLDEDSLLVCLTCMVGGSCDSIRAQKGRDSISSTSCRCEQENRTEVPIRVRFEEGH